MHFIDLEVGSRLRRERLAMGRSIAEQAAAIDVSEERLAAFEDGTERVPAALLQRCCQTLGLRPADLYGGLATPGGEPGAEACRAG